MFIHLATSDSKTPFEIHYKQRKYKLQKDINKMEEDWKIMMPVASMEVKYLRPVFYDEEITIRTIINELPEKFVNFNCELYNEAGKLVNAAKVRLCFVDMEKGKTCPKAPTQLIEKLQSVFEQKKDKKYV